MEFRYELLALAGIVYLFSALFGENALGQQTSDERIIPEYIGDDKTSHARYHHGRMRPAIGTQNYQILRANRSHPELADGLGWTYNHAPNLAWWNGHFILHYLSNSMGEHIPPGVTLIAKSRDGMNWEQPQVVFPIYSTTETTDTSLSVVKHYMHQRMGFYVSPEDRLLVMGYYGGPYGDGIGRVVREIYEDFSLGPIYFMRVNDNWDGDVHYPMYNESSDPGFVKAAESFLSDRIRRIQWWNEDFKAADADTFYMPYEMKEAFSFYTISDSLVMGYFKNRMVTYTRDKGKNWKKPGRAESITYGGAKVWGQKLDNGQYALVYNPTDSKNRYPLAVAVSDDGIHFDKLSVVHGEVPEKRYWGMAKRPGPQYTRGIVEGNGNPPGEDLWVAYSVNKEDMWISRIPVPVQRTLQGPVQDDFSSMETGGKVNNWNIYSPLWSPVKIVDFPDGKNKSLMLMDFDPYDYAKATRVFGQAARQRISFDLFVQSNPDIFRMEICDAKGERLIQSTLNNKYVIHTSKGPNTFKKVETIPTEKWITITFEVNSEDSVYDLYIEGILYAENHEFTSNGRVERILFQTGDYRMENKIQKYKSGSGIIPGYDEPDSEQPVDEAVFYIRNFSTEII